MQPPPDVNPEVELLCKLAEATRLVSEPDPLAGTLQRICGVADESLPGCEVGMSLGGAARQLETGASSTERAERLDAAQRDAEEGPCLDALSTQVALAADHTRLVQRWRRFGPVATAAGVRAVLALPFLVDDRSRGAINVYAFQERALGDQAVRLARLLADQATNVVGNAQAYARSTALSRNLSLAMQTRGVIEQAKGIVMWHRSCPEEEAFELLRRASQTNHVKVRDLARELVDAARAAAGAGPSPVDLPPHLAGLLGP